MMKMALKTTVDLCSTVISSDGSKQGATSFTTDVHLPSLYYSPAGTPSHHYFPVSYSYNMSSYCPAFYPPQSKPHNQFRPPLEVP